MCGRLFIKPVTELQELLEMLGILNITLPMLNNIAPTETIPLIHQSSTGLAVSSVRWWLHPHWSKEEPNQKFAMFNARIETLLTSPSFRGPVRSHRGIVPAAGFIEWKREGKQKQPFYIDAGSEPLLLAAVWDIWQEQVMSCAIITQAANTDFAEVHDRMPLSLTIAQAQRWLDPKQDAKMLVEEFAGASLALRMRAVTTAVNNARHKDELIFLDALA
ncbi:MAG: SOS response-associated peptidase [Pseudomonadota bacterium]